MARKRSEPAVVAAARRAGVRDPRLLEALAAVPREGFLPPEARGEVDVDRPVPIGQGQTTSQPSLIAKMIEALELTGTERVLEVGTGFGYQAALLAHLAAEVYTIERFADLAVTARENLAGCGLEDVEVVTGDGTLGLPEHAPFDAIIVAAAAPEVPTPLAEQLADGGRLVAPVGPSGQQTVEVYEGRGGRLEHVRRLGGVRFVPLVPGEVE